MNLEARGFTGAVKQASKHEELTWRRSVTVVQDRKSAAADGRAFCLTSGAHTKRQRATSFHFTRACTSTRPRSGSPTARPQVTTCQSRGVSVPRSRPQLAGPSSTPHPSGLPCATRLAGTRFPPVRSAPPDAGLQPPPADPPPQSGPRRRTERRSPAGPAGRNPAGAGAESPAEPPARPKRALGRGRPGGAGGTLRGRESESLPLPRFKTKQKKKGRKKERERVR